MNRSLSILLIFVAALFSFAGGMAMSAFRQPVVLHDLANRVQDGSVMNAEVGYFSGAPVDEWRFAGEAARLVTDTNGRRYLILTAAPYDWDAGTIPRLNGVTLLNSSTPATAGATCDREGFVVTQTDFPNKDITYMCCKEGSGNIWVKGYCHPDGG